MEEFVSEAEAVYRNRQIFFSKYDKTVKMTAYQRCMGMDFFFFFLPIPDMQMFFNLFLLLWIYESKTTFFCKDFGLISTSIIVVYHNIS